MTRGTTTCLVLAGVLEASVANATVSYPPVEEYQAKAYERYASECLVRLGVPADCTRLLETAIEFDPNQASSHHTLGWLYLRSGNLARALAEFANALRLDPSLNDAIKAMGDIYSEQGKLALAQEKYEQYLKAAPYDPMSYYNLAALSAQRGATEDALRLLEVAVSQGFVDFDYLEADSRWNRLKEDPRVQALRPGR